MNILLLKNKSKIFLMVYLLISLILMIFTSQTLSFTPRAFLGMVTYPFINLYHFALDKSISFATSVNELNKLKLENQELKKEIKTLKETQYNYNFVLNENQLLKKLLNLQNQYDFPTEVAKIIAKDPSNLTLL